jgi:oligoribonuclease (3'-5' exoribonuclease)
MTEPHEQPIPQPIKKYKTIDVMLDLETVGLCDNAVITQLSAVAFSIDDGSVHETFDEHIGIKNSVQKGLKIDGSSMEWWFKQPDKVYEDVFVKAMTSEVKLEDILVKFTGWIKSLKEKYGLDHKSNVNMWGNGALADNKWIRQAYKVCNMEPPWAFYEDRDVRTIVELGRRLLNYEYKNVTFEGTVHNALDDCRHQIKYCFEIYNKLKNQKA